MSDIRSFKAAITTRVDPTQAERLFSESRQLGNPMCCPKSAMDPNVDEFGRPLGGARHRLLLMNDAACSQFVYPCSRKLRHENADRPILGPCDPGNRGAGDLIYGSARDHFPQCIYGEGCRGNFVSPYLTGIRSPEEFPEDVHITYEKQTAKPLILSHDALTKPFRG